MRRPTRRTAGPLPPGPGPALPQPRGKRPAHTLRATGLAHGTDAPPERDDFADSDTQPGDTLPGMPQSLEDTARWKVADVDAAIVVADDTPRLPGNYRLLEPIASGGMGVVYKARHVHLDRLVAVKLAHESLIDGEVRERFSREAAATAAIHHPGVAAIHDFGYTPRGRPYLVLEYLEGESLATRLARGPLAVDEAVEIAAQVADVMEAAHHANVVHRDLSPGNVFLARDEAGALRVKVLDFGVAKLTAPDLARHTLDDRLLGTPPYMAPEQSLNPTLADHRSDVYALGCLLYAMLTGRPPFDGGLTAVIEAQRNRAPDPSPLDHAPTALRALVLEMLAKRATERPPTMRVVHERLAAIAERSAACDATARVLRLAGSPHPAVRVGAAVVLAVVAALILVACGVLG